MRMLIHSSSGRPVEAAMLVAGVNTLRIAVEGRDDVTELRWVSGHWVSETNDLVEIEFRDEDIDPPMFN